MSLKTTDKTKRLKGPHLDLYTFLSYNKKNYIAAVAEG